MDHRESKGIKKKSTSVSLTTLKPLTMWIATNCGKFLKRWEYQTIFPASREICVQVKKQQWEVDVEQWTGSKLGKEYTKATYCHLAYLTYMHSPSHPIEVFIANVVSSNTSLSCVISVIFTDHESFSFSSLKSSDSPSAVWPNVWFMVINV